MPNPKLDIDSVLDECRQMISVGSKSFSLASRLFGSTSKKAAFFLYGWCRFCDDQIDDAKTREQAEVQLTNLRDRTNSALRGELQDHPVFVAFQYVAQNYKIPKEYPLDLLEGMAADVRNQKYETLDDLKVYCYQVAGTVGLMMVHIMGISDEVALQNACDLGIAMQMTNISRDILTDYKMGRIYLPLQWLREEGIEQNELIELKNRAKLVKLVRRLVEEAQLHYQSGRKGLRYLPFRAALAVSAACSIYSQIGHHVLLREGKAWDSRTIVPKWRKVMALLRGVVLVFKSIPIRMSKPWNSVSITAIWRQL